MNTGGGLPTLPHVTGQWLLALAGEAGSGKSTLSRALGRRLQWPVIDKDDIKDLLYGQAPDSGALAYQVMFNVARRQLLLGLSVICDSPLTGRIAYDRAAGIAAETGASLALWSADARTSRCGASASTPVKTCVCLHTTRPTGSQCRPGAITSIPCAMTRLPGIPTSWWRP